MKAISRTNSGIASTRVWLGASQRLFSTDVVPNYEHLIDLKYGIGRQSVNNVTCTVFGSYGFLGRYVVNRLGRIGSQVICPYRGDGMKTRHLKLMGDLGQIVQTPMDMTDVDSIRKAVEHSNVVINMVGSAQETKNYSYDDVHVKCAHRIAKVCAEAGGVKRFIHVSAAGADHESNSAFLRSKAGGEDAVKAYFPQATIIRPHEIFGQEDKFLNRWADMMAWFPVTPLLNRNKKIQPIYVQDVAQCIVNAMVNSDAVGQTYQLGGPEVITQEQLLSFIRDDISRPETSIIEMPEFTARLYAKAVEQFMPGAWRLLTPDDVDRAFKDETVPKGALGCKDLGVTPVRLAKEGPNTLVRHRGPRDAKHNQFDLAKGYGKLQDL